MIKRRKPFGNSVQINIYIACQILILEFSNKLFNYLKNLLVFFDLGYFEVKKKNHKNKICWWYKFCYGFKLQYSSIIRKIIDNTVVALFNGLNWMFVYVLIYSRNKTPKITFHPAGITFVFFSRRQTKSWGCRFCLLKEFFYYCINYWMDLAIIDYYLSYIMLHRFKSRYHLGNTCERVDTTFFTQFR